MTRRERNSCAYRRGVAARKLNRLQLVSLGRWPVSVTFGRGRGRRRGVFYEAKSMAHVRLFLQGYCGPRNLLVVWRMMDWLFMTHHNHMRRWMDAMAHGTGKEHARPRTAPTTHRRTGTSRATKRKS